MDEANILKAQETKTATKDVWKEAFETTEASKMELEANKAGEKAFEDDAAYKEELKAIIPLCSRNFQNVKLKLDFVEIC